MSNSNHGRLDVHLCPSTPDLSFCWHSCQGPEKRAEYGIVDNLVRFSCGVEHQEDIWEDLCQALDQLRPSR